MYGPTFFRRRYQASPYGGLRYRRRYGSVKGSAASYNNSTRSTLRGPSGKGGLANQVKEIRSYIRKLAPELKSNDQDCDISNLTTAGAIADLTGIAQGTDDNQRTGNAINVTRIIVNGIIIRAADFTNGTVRNSYIRFAIVQDMQSADGATPAVASMFLNAAEPWNLIAPGQFSRYKVLWSSQLFDLARVIPDSDEVTLIPTQTPVFHADIACNIKVEYNGNAAGDIEKNGIWFVALTNNSVSTGDIECTGRVVYTDV